MALAGDAHIARRIETLSPKPPRRSGKGAECEISVTGFELRLEMPGIERHRAQAELASLAREPSEKRWQEDDGADIGDEEGEGRSLVPGSKAGVAHRPSDAASKFRSGSAMATALGVSCIA